MFKHCYSDSIDAGQTQLADAVAMSRGAPMTIIADPRNLFPDIYENDDITASECRSIFLGWVLELPDEADVRRSMKIILDKYTATHPNHPMTEILREGIEQKARGARKGRGK